ncbi:5-oxoprolinase subunit C family protein [Robertkochia sediminum]|uniref:5-oxoprolinase subunit C family protein n=1 Tax=Robertkochia sediminum TaxID=2785326 RepID=UPI0019337D1D|nr:biotin-dependent carboxyltransferase family protein [Robertkochia sediminum]MBL7473373.1 biotin-dependent carboxyltransferase family protein [Robertkochia sediminum]
MIKVLNPGLFTTLQDEGRFGLRDKGVPVSGAMDPRAARVANLLLGNKAGAAVMEITMTGPELEFDKECDFAICGAMLSPELDGEALQNNTVYTAKAGQHLKFGRLVKGYRAYLAVKGGFDTPEVLGSRSWYKPVTARAMLKKGDSLETGKAGKQSTKNVPEYPQENLEGDYIEVYKGPEYDLLSADQKSQLEKGIFKVANESNRMAYQLQEKILGHSHSILTSSTLPGTVQLTPDGRIIILMKDAQTTGGYPRILQLSDEGLAFLSQKKTGDQFLFRIK